MSSYSKTFENYSHCWWTPPEWVDWVTSTLGPAWYDPCPTDWSPESPSGLETTWGTRTYINHPGERGSTQSWWERTIWHHRVIGMQFVWCAFNCEQVRHMYPSPRLLPDLWFIEPKERTGFVWGGPTLYKGDKDKGAKATTENPSAALLGPDGRPIVKRLHGERASSPGNWTIFISSVEPAQPPVDSIIYRVAR